MEEEGKGVRRILFKDPAAAITETLRSFALPLFRLKFQKEQVGF